MPEDYAWWMSALEMVGDYGVLSREQGYALGIHEDEPKCGFYRVPPMKRRMHEDPWAEVMVAIWRGADGRLVATWDGQSIDAVSAWSWCCRYPIDEDRYRAWEKSRPTLGLFA